MTTVVLDVVFALLGFALGYALAFRHGHASGLDTARVALDNQEVRIVTAEEARHWSPVLEKMVELVNEVGGVTFGEALARACKELSMKPPPSDSDAEGALLVSAFRIVGSKRIPGAPDA